MSNWATTALLFPGQGSQEVGMGADLVQAFPAARDVFQAADDILGFALSDLCWHGPAADLNDTINTQPALYVAGIATLRALESAIGPVQPAYMAGHSLGELTALAAAGALTFADGLRLVRERGRLMKEAGDSYPGAMAAILGLDAAAIHTVCAQASEETGQRLVLANDNCPGQIVISGDEAALARGLELANEAGAKRAIQLAVSIASHSPLMAPAADAFRSALAETAFQPTQVPVLGNVTAEPLGGVEAIREELGAQLTSPVRWTESMQLLGEAGITRYIELGPKDILSGLMRRIDRKAKRIALNSAQAVQNFAAAFSDQA